MPSFSSEGSRVTISLDILKSILEDVYREGFRGSMESMDSIVLKSLAQTKEASAEIMRPTVYNNPYPRTYDTPF